MGFCVFLFSIRPIFAKDKSIYVECYCLFLLLSSLLCVFSVCSVLSVLLLVLCCVVVHLVQLSASNLIYTWKRHLSKLYCAIAISVHRSWLHLVRDIGLNDWIRVLKCCLLLCFKSPCFIHQNQEFDGVIENLMGDKKQTQCYYLPIEMYVRYGYSQFVPLNFIPLHTELYSPHNHKHT